MNFWIGLAIGIVAAVVVSFVGAVGFFAWQFYGGDE